MATRATLLLFCAALLATGVHAWGPFGGSDGNEDDCPPWSDDCSSSSSSNNDDGRGFGSSSSSSFSQSSFLRSSGSFNHARNVLIAHAVMASLVWVIFIPSFAILLRLNLKSPTVLRLHAVGQVLSYLVYIVAAGMGIWLAQQSPRSATWDDPHPKIGIAVLVLAFFQPIVSPLHRRLPWLEFSTDNRPARGHPPLNIQETRPTI
jgi:hypothetical protein